jgi:hypothetical protein
MSNCLLTTSRRMRGTTENWRRKLAARALTATVGGDS